VISEENTVERFEVVVAGAGPVGLSTALFLADPSGARNGTRVHVRRQQPGVDTGADSSGGFAAQRITDELAEHASRSTAAR
jgi:2-polyprenyl-6-methoxyphenol hydroxylase-like FAD-dependent oxidoreductase